MHFDVTHDFIGKHTRACEADLIGKVDNGGDDIESLPGIIRQAAWPQPYQPALIVGLFYYELLLFTQICPLY